MNFSLSYREAKSATFPYLDRLRKFYFAFRNPQYDPNYALHFQELLPILDSHQYLRDRVTVQDIVSAYDRLKVDAGADQIKLNTNLEMMDNLISILQDNNLTQLLIGLKISDLTLFDGEKRLRVRARIDQLKIPLNFNQELVELLLEINEITEEDVENWDELRERLAEGEINLPDTVLALLQCGRRIDLTELLYFCPPIYVDATFPLLRRSFLDDPNLDHDDDVHDYLALYLDSLTYLIHIPQIFTYVRKRAGKFIENRHDREEFIKNISESDHKSVAEIFNEHGPIFGDTILHFLAAMKHEIYKWAPQAFAKLMKIPGININAVNKAGETPAHLAILGGQLHILNDLTKHDGFDATIANNKGDTILHELARMLPKLDDTGAIRDAFNRLMKNTININAVNHDGDTALHIVLRNGLASTMMKDLDRQAVTSAAMPKWAALNWIVVFDLVMRDEFDHTIANKKGETVLQLANQLEDDPFQFKKVLALLQQTKKPARG